MTDEKKEDPASLTETGTGAQITAPTKTDDAVLNKLRELDDRNRTLTAEIEELKKPKTPEVPVSEQNKAFWNDPVTVLRKEMADTVKPLIEFREEFRATSLLDKVKAEYKNAPQYKEFMAQPGVEAYVDQLMSKNTGIKDEREIGNAMQAAILSVKGAMELGLIPKPAGENRADPNANKKPEEKVEQPNVIPPHLRPSSAPKPSGDTGGKKLRDLTETEERMRRENKLSHAEFIELTDEVSPAGVVGWKPESQRKEPVK